MSGGAYGGFLCRPFVQLCRTFILNRKESVAADVRLRGRVFILHIAADVIDVGWALLPMMRLAWRQRHQEYSRYTWSMQLLVQAIYQFMTLKNRGWGSF